MTQQARLDLADMVRELTERHTHREHYAVRRSGTWYGEDHTTQVPALLAQLVVASPSGAVDERDNHGYGSRPTIRVDAIDTLSRIDDEAARWVRWLGHDDPGDKIDPKTGRALPGSGTRRCVRLLGGLAPSLPAAVRTQLLRDVRRWWTWARIVSGWDSPAWRPDNTCPMCGERRSLRVNLAAQAAFCVHDQCRETWDATNIGLLADHIRTESEQERQPLPDPLPCQCRWPRGLAEQGRWGLCPRCGSPCCLNADAVAEREEQKRREAAERRRLEELERIAANYARARRLAASGRPA